jgi:WD40 repeat protein
MAFSSHDNLASVADDQTLRLWDVTSRRPLSRPLPDRGRFFSSVAFDPHGRTLASAGEGWT